MHFVTSVDMLYVLALAAGAVITPGHLAMARTVTVSRDCFNSIVMYRIVLHCKVHFIGIVVNDNISSTQLRQCHHFVTVFEIYG